VIAINVPSVNILRLGNGGSLMRAQLPLTYLAGKANSRGAVTTLSLI